MNLNLTSKFCGRCKKRKALNVYNFYRNSRGDGDGFENRCRECVLKIAKMRRK